MGRREEAVATYRRARALYEDTNGTEHDQANCLRGLANTLRHLGREEEAEPLYHQALALYEQFDGKEQEHAN